MLTFAIGDIQDVTTDTHSKQDDQAKEVAFCYMNIHKSSKDPPSEPNETHSITSKPFHLDSGSTFHTHNKLSDLHNVQPCFTGFFTINGSETQATHKGDLHLITDTGLLILSNV